MSNDSTSQTKSLQLLLKIARHSRTIAKEFDGLSSYELLIKVFSTDLFVMSADFLKVFLF